VFNQGLEVSVMGLDLGVEVEPTARESAQAGLGRSRRGRHRPGTQRGEMTDQRHRARNRIKLFAQGSRHGDDDGLQGQHGLGSCLDGRVAGDLQVADHLDPAGGRFGQAGGLAAEHGTGGALRIERIGLAVLAPQPAVGPADLVDGVAAVAKGAGETGAVRAGAFDAEGVDGSERFSPGFELAVAVPADLDRQLRHSGAESGNCHGGVGVLVSVDTDDDVGG
jgi:hypothetical protein